MIRKYGLALLAALLMLLPVSAAIGGKANAASSSRIAVIKQLSGDVEVQKAGGSKQFKAFAKLSLNQGDKLITGSKGSAVLQFANGTSEDDKFTVGENATLTFSKLSDKKGTVTKVSMLKGTAWVDVKSIKSKDDDFKLETPTAIMGVRGTAFFARVNPATGGTNTAVMSGVVRFTSENVENMGSGSGESAGGTGSSGSSKTIDLYPTQQISLEPTSGDDLREKTTLVDIEEIVKNAPPEVIEAILRSKEKIDEENRQTVDKFKQTGVPAELQQSLDKFAQNIEELLGVIAKQAIEQKKIDQQQVKKIEEQEKTSFNLTKDRLELTDLQKQKQQAVRQKQEEAAKKKAAEDAAKKQELEERLAGQMQAIEAAKLAQTEANRKAAAEAAAKAETALLGSMTPIQKQQYNKDKANNYGSPAPAQTAAPTPTPTAGSQPTPTPPSDDVRLNGLSLPSGIELSPAFAPEVLNYTINVGSAVSSIAVTPALHDPGAKLTVNDRGWTGGSVTIPLAYGNNTIVLAVTAANGKATRSYTITAVRHLLNSADIDMGSGTPLHIDFTAAFPMTTFDVPQDTSVLTLKLPLVDAPSVTVNGEPVSPVGARIASLAFVAEDKAWTYTFLLKPGANTIEIKAAVEGATKTYTLIANKTAALTALPDFLETTVNTPVSGALKSYGGNGAASYEIIENGESGEVTLDSAASGAFTYTPGEDFTGMDSFQFKAIAGGEESESATVLIWVKPADFELKGLTSVSIVWGGVPAVPMYLSGYQDGSYKSKDYGVFVSDEEDENVEMQFAFDPAAVSDARLVFGEEIIDQEADGSLHGSFPIEGQGRSVTLYYSVTENDRTVYYQVNYVFVKQQLWSAYLPTGGKAQVHLVPVGGGDYTVSVQNKDEELLLHSSSYDATTESDVWVYVKDKDDPSAPPKREKANRNGEGDYKVPLSPGWNVAEIRTYYPGYEGSAKEGVVHIWKGDGLPDGYEMASVRGTPVQYPAEASAAPREFIRDASWQSVYRVAMPSDTVAMDVKPVAGPGVKVDAVYQGGYTSFVRVGEAPVGSGRYQVQLYGDWQNFGFVVVSPVSGEGPPLAYTLDMELEQAVNIEANLVYEQDGISREVQLNSFAGSDQGLLNEAAGQSGFKLLLTGVDPRSDVRINGVAVPYDASGLRFAYPFTPQEGDQTFLVEATDPYGNYGSLDIRFSYGTHGLTPVGLDSWSAQSSDGEAPASEVPWIYAGMNTFRLTVPDNQSQLNLQWAAGAGTAQVTLLAPLGAAYEGSYAGDLPMGRSDYMLILKDEDGSRIEYELYVYRGAPVAPSLILPAFGGTVPFEYNASNGSYEASVEAWPEKFWINLGMPAGSSADMTANDIHYSPNGDGLYELEPDSERDEIILNVTGILDGVAWYCDLAIKRATD
ncbi:cadherin-like beta sandwich domain-containing protein [Cohnella sp. GbtcB17]|uniref:cadherin-like beta sandwich domain-containing protein n=1 Tax=Cohnella sp. GbtcB17 TaxID=2824762 RepID=UPI001C307C0B|nr:cadherin-like beta sandwich domain-containing protein [Cohnella sp. GbtcB17]